MGSIEFVNMCEITCKIGWLWLKNHVLKFNIKNMLQNFTKQKKMVEKELHKSMHCSYSTIKHQYHRLHEITVLNTLVVNIFTFCLIF